jgi:acyl-homoserine lactone acylase PvdQ
MDKPGFLLRALAVASLAALPAPVAASGSSDMARWRAEAARVTITRDDWGIPPRPRSN